MNYYLSLCVDDFILRVMILCYVGFGVIKIWSIDENLIEIYDDIVGFEEFGIGVKCILIDYVWFIDDSIVILIENKVIFIVKGGEVKYVCFFKFCLLILIFICFLSFFLIILY